MKDIKLFLLTVLVKTVIFSNICAMEESTLSTPDAEIESLNRDNQDCPDYLASLPNETLVQILTHFIEADLKNIKNIIDLEKGIKKACKKLLALRRTSSIYKNFLTIETIGLILRNTGINLNMISDSGRTLLDLIIDDDIEQTTYVRILIAAGANVNIAISPNIQMNPGNLYRFPMRRTPLHTAVLNNHINIVAELINAGADITAQINNPKCSSNGCTPLDFARRKCHWTIIHMLEAAYIQRGMAIPGHRAPHTHAPDPLARRLIFD